MNRKHLITWFFVCSVCCLLPVVSYGITKSEVGTITRIESTGATTAVVDKSPGPRKRFPVSWLHMLDGDVHDDSKKSSVLAFAPQVPTDIARVLNSVGGNKGFWAFVLVVVKAFLSIALGFLLRFLIQKTFRARLESIRHLVPPDGGGGKKFVSGLFRSLPGFASLFLLAIFSTLIFLALAGDTPAQGRMFYQLILGIVLIYILFRLIGEILFAPDDEKVRLVAIDATLIRPLHVAFSITFTLLGSAVLFGHCFNELGARPQTLAWIAIVLGTVILLIIAGLIVFLRKPVADYFEKKSAEDPERWIQRQFALFWHLPALLYVAVVWIFWVTQKAMGTIGDSRSFIASVIVVPLYFVLSYFARLLIGAVVASLGLGKIGVETEEDADVTIEEVIEERNRQLAGRTYRLFRYLLIFVLFVWVCSLWGYRLPFANQAMKAIFESFVVVALALVCWRSASAYIESKMADSVVPVDEEQDIDDEFGGATPRGRSHTLLPLLRKVIGSTLVLMVSLIIISSLGVDIGPLLAGAGVLGLAIGFGAQKLVSDVLSGFFFLFDDAFRVGEYVQAGKIRGTVEAITLRNVLLRHHLGMLQVVPYSDLGAITNYMRGGIVIKFPLEFPYDTDIDLVRKIIKKVGQAMLTDEELGDGFLQPVKSQGVYEITNSVMVIRVKFTAKPGKQFLIKREAFRRITEALNAKGIYYAHRKVIVDFPDEMPQKGIDGQTKQKAMQAGAAAAVLEEPTVPGEEKG